MQVILIKCIIEQIAKEYQELISKDPLWFIELRKLGDCEVFVLRFSIDFVYLTQIDQV